MSQLAPFLELQREYASHADFAFCYLEEAHPTDGWLYESVNHYVAQPKTMHERCIAAEILANELRSLRAPPDVPLVVDTMTNAASIAYGALPERLVILQSGLVRFIGGKGPEEYSIDEARIALRQLLGA